MRIVALREGPIELRGAGVAIDGEPLIIDAEGRLHRDPRLSHGLEPILVDSMVGSTLAFVGDPNGIAFVTTRLDFNRAATEYKVYAREGASWTRMKLDRGPVLEYYPSLFARGDAIFGLRAYAANPKAEGVDDEENDAFDAKFAAALGKAKPGFVQLAGPSAELPKLAKTTAISQAATTRDGTLYAITQAKPQRSPDDPEDETWTPSVLVWAPGTTTAKSLALPDYAKPEDDEPHFSLSIAGNHVLIGGMTNDERPYLVVAEGERIELVSEGLPVAASAWSFIRSATRSPTGQIWAVVGDPEHEYTEWDQRDPLWTRDPTTKIWTRVELPKVTDPRFGSTEPRWIYSNYDQSWQSAQFEALADQEPVAAQISWIAGAPWIVATLGDALGEDAGILMMPQLWRHALFTTRAGQDPARILPSFDQMMFEQRAGLAPADAKPGAASCKHLWFVFDLPVPSASDLGALDESAFGLTVAQLDALGEFEGIPDDEGHGSSRFEQIYVGERDGKRELVMLAEADEPDRVGKLLAAITRLTGMTPKVDCRARSLVHMIRSFSA